MMLIVNWLAQQFYELGQWVHIYEIWVQLGVEGSLAAPWWLVSMFGGG